MSAPFHLAVWIDRHSAHVYSFMPDGLRESRIQASRAHDTGHVHHKSGTVGAGHADIGSDFLKDVAAAIGEAQEVLIVGPAEAKFALKAFLEDERPALAARVVGVKPMDRAGDSEIQAYARRYFTHVDQLMPARK